MSSKYAAWRSDDTIDEVNDRLSAAMDRRGKIMDTPGVLYRMRVADRRVVYYILGATSASSLVVESITTFYGKVYRIRHHGHMRPAVYALMEGADVMKDYPSVF